MDYDIEIWEGSLSRTTLIINGKVAEPEISGGRCWEIILPRIKAINDLRLRI